MVDPADVRFRRSADRLQVVSRHLAAPAIGHELELDLLTFAQRAHAGALNGADMNERILAAIVGWMKPKPFWALNHFTVPVVMGDPFTSRSMLPTRNPCGEAGRPSNSHLFSGARSWRCGHFYARRQSSSVYRHPAYGRLPANWQGPLAAFHAGPQGVGTGHHRLKRRLAMAERGVCSRRSAEPRRDQRLSALYLNMQATRGSIQFSAG